MKEKDSLLATFKSQTDKQKKEIQNLREKLKVRIDKLIKLRLLFSI